MQDLITEADFSARPFRCHGDSGDAYLADAVDHRHRRRRRAGWAWSRRSGCKAAASPPAPPATASSIRGKHVAVVGGGNTAVEEALYLTHHADHVTLVHRRDALRAEKILQARLFANPKISVVWNSVVEEILGGGTPEVVDRRAAARRAQPAHDSGLPVDGVFVAIGHTPEHRDLRGQLDDGRGGLHPDRAGQHPHLGTGRVRRRRRAGQDLPPGGDRGGHRLHGGARGGEVPRRTAETRHVPRQARGEVPDRCPASRRGGLGSDVCEWQNLAQQTRASR